MKICSKCNQPKEDSDFYKQSDRKNGASFCKSCFNKYCIKRWQDRKIKAIEYMGGECVDCKISYLKYPPDIFHFHHLNPGEKDADWGKLRLKSWDKIKLELDKCVMLCSNCHIIRHYNQFWNL